VPRKRMLFSAGTNGSVFAWVIDKIFATDHFEDLSDKPVEKKELEYRNFTAEKTPWFISLKSHASCIVDLPNIE